MSEELKKAYREKTEAQMREWEIKLEELTNKAAALSADAKIRALEKIEGIKGKMKEGRANLNRLKSEGESGWESLKTKIEGISEGVKNGLKDILGGS